MAVSARLPAFWRSRPSTFGLLAGAVGARVPAAVGGLIVGEPFQRRPSRRPRFRPCRRGSRPRRPDRGHAEPIGVGQRLRRRCRRAASRRQSQLWSGAAMRPDDAASPARRVAAARMACPARPARLPYAASPAITFRRRTRPTGLSAAWGDRPGADCRAGLHRHRRRSFCGSGTICCSNASGTSLDVGRAGWAGASSARRSGGSDVAYRAAGGAASRRWAGGASMAAADFARRSLGRADDGRRFRAERFGLGERHVIERPDRRATSDPRRGPGASAPPADRPCPLQLPLFGRSDGIAGKTPPRADRSALDDQRPGRRRRRLLGRRVAERNLDDRLRRRHDGA